MRGDQQSTAGVPLFRASELQRCRAMRPTLPGTGVHTGRLYAALWPQPMAAKGRVVTMQDRNVLNAP